MSCDVGKAPEGLENELWHKWSDRKVGDWVLLILQPFRCFTYVTVYSPTLLSVLLCHWLFTYVTWRTAHVSHTTFQCFFINLSEKVYLHNVNKVPFTPYDTMIERDMSIHPIEHNRNYIIFYWKLILLTWALKLKDFYWKKTYKALELTWNDIISITSL